MYLREDLLTIFNSGVAAVSPDNALLEHVRLRDGKLLAGGRTFDLTKGRVFVAGAGKGAAPMAVALEKLLASNIDAGAVVVKYDHTLPTEKIIIYEASHPVPDEAGQKAAEICLKLAENCAEDDLLICLFTGGASALLPLPAQGLDLEDIRQTTDLLLKSGAEIDEINALRKHLSAISGGRVAAACKGTVLSLIVSDVIGDNLSAIASGPTAPDPTTFDDCLLIIHKYNLEEKIPRKILHFLESGARGEISETPKPGDPCFRRVTNIIIASNRQALEAAASKARELGYATWICPQVQVGEARFMARELIRKARIKSDQSEKNFCLISGGETTVTIKGDGLGGRNQEMALAAALSIKNERDIGALFGGTDGTDGPTAAAGGFAFGNTAEKIGPKAEELLDNNDSYTALQKAGDLLITGPTRTNVMDMAIIIITKNERGYLR